MGLSRPFNDMASSTLERETGVWEGEEEEEEERKRKIRREREIKIGMRRGKKKNNKRSGSVGPRRKRK